MTPYWITLNAPNAGAFLGWGESRMINHIQCTVSGAGAGHFHSSKAGSRDAWGRGLILSIALEKDAARSILDAQRFFSFRTTLVRR